MDIDNVNEATKVYKSYAKDITDRVNQLRVDEESKKHICDFVKVSTELAELTRLYFLSYAHDSKMHRLDTEIANLFSLTEEAIKTAKVDPCDANIEKCEAALRDLNDKQKLKDKYMQEAAEILRGFKDLASSLGIS